MSYTLTDEFGFAFTVDDTPAETRRDSNGRILGPRQWDDESYDQRQIRPKEPKADVQGNAITGP